MTIAATAILLAVGMALDIGRMFIAKNETQNFCDSAALAAALALDGTSNGIANAKTAVSNSTDKWNFGTTSVSDSTVLFSSTATGPWGSNPSTPSAILYTKVTATAPVSMYFMPVISHLFTQDVSSIATGGQVPMTTIKQGLAPYTAVSTNSTPPNFGLVVGQSYDMQWPATNGNNNFVQPACSGDSTASKNAVLANWGSSDNGYWGASANSSIAAEVLDQIQLTAISTGTNIMPVLTNGNKAAEAVYLDDRASEDINYTDNSIGINPASGYMADTHNGRRLMAVPIVDPVSPTETDVIGYGVFLLFTNGSTSNYYQKTANGNDPFCAMYAGAFDLSNLQVGVGGTTGATQVELVQ